MPRYAIQYIAKRLKAADIPFGLKLRLVAKVLNRLELIESVKIIRLLLESALSVRPSNEELYDLCEVSERSEVLHDFLRGFFIHEGADPARLEMAERLEGIISFRMTQNAAHRPNHRL